MTITTKLRINALILILSALGMMVSIYLTITHIPSVNNCAYPVNYYLKSTSLVEVNIVEGCTDTRGYWKDTLTGEPYYNISNMQIAKYITDGWINDRAVPVGRLVISKLADDDKNLYTIGRKVRPIEPFKTSQLSDIGKCIYYTQFDALVTKYRLAYNPHERAYIDTLLNSCNGAKIREDIPLVF